MSVEQNVAICNRFVEEGLNQGNILAVADQLALPDLQLEAPGIPTAEGHATGFDIFKQFVSMFTGAFPDLKCTLPYTIAEDDIVAMDIAYSGTHAKQFGPFPATNNFVEGGELWYVKFRDGKMAHIRICEYGTPLAAMIS